MSSAFALPAAVFQDFTLRHSLLYSPRVLYNRGIQDNGVLAGSRRWDRTACKKLHLKTIMPIAQGSRPRFNKV